MVSFYYHLWTVWRRRRTEEVLGPGVKMFPQIRPSGGMILIKNNMGQTDGGAAG